MHPLAPALDVFWHNAWMLRNAVADLKPDQETFSLAPSNTYNRIVGHIVASRHGLCQMIGIEVPDLDWGEFGAFKLAAQFDEGNAVPPIDEMMATFASVSKQMVAGMEAMTLDDLRTPSPMPIPGDNPDFRNLIAFFAMHESYHIGQLGLLNRAMGRKGIMGA